MITKRCLVPAIALVLLAGAAMACGGGGNADGGDPPPAESGGGNDEGPLGLPARDGGAIEPSDTVSFDNPCIEYVDGQGPIDASDSDPPISVEPVEPGPVTMDPEEPARDAEDEARDADEAARDAEDEALAADGGDGLVLASEGVECEPGELGEPLPPADGPVRSDEDIDPSECNLVHNIDACSPEEIAQGFPNQPAAPQTEPSD